MYPQHQEQPPPLDSMKNNYEVTFAVRPPCGHPQWFKRQYFLPAYGLGGVSRRTEQLAGGVEKPAEGAQAGFHISGPMIAPCG